MKKGIFKMKKNLITLMALVACAVSVSSVNATQLVYSVPTRADFGANLLKNKLQYVAPTKALAVKNAVKTNAQTVGGKFFTANAGGFAPGAQLNLSTGGMVQGANVATGNIAKQGKTLLVQGLTGTNLRGALTGLTGTGASASAAQPGILEARTADNTFASVQDHDLVTDGMMNVVLTGSSGALGNTALTHNMQTSGGSLNVGGISSIGQNLAFVGNNGINS
jgi:hypothetical protein